MYKEYYLIGNGLAQSTSARYFNAKFRESNIDAAYFNLDTPELPDLHEFARIKPHLCGMNITSPYKVQVMTQLDEVDFLAQIVGAVNCIKVVRNGDEVRLVGYNTDVIGFYREMQEINCCSKKALILGSGGAAKAVASALRLMNVKCVIVSRNPGEGTISYKESRDLVSKFRLIVNCTPLGQHPGDDVPTIRYDRLTRQHTVIDLNYSTTWTPFLVESVEYGARCINGLGMLTHQADASWEVWNRV